MKKFRVVRGGVSEAGKPYGFGMTREAETAREAVSQDEQIFNERNPTMEALVGYRKPDPITKVYELVEVPKEEWA